jgi:hypothetical protein
MRSRKGPLACANRVAASGVLRWDWLNGSAQYLFYEDGKFAPWLGALLLSTPTRRLIIGSAVAASELALGALLSIRRTRRAGPFAAFGLHAGFEVAASPELFGWVMAALLLSFWEPSTARARGVTAVSGPPDLQNQRIPLSQ